MNHSEFQLPNPPIVEAVLDIECDLQPGQQLTELEEKAREAFRDHYPKLHPQVIQEHKIEAKPDAPPQVSFRHGLLSLQCLSDDEKQIVQVRGQGYSFNRLAPYTSLDDYLPEIERTWKLYLDLVEPVQIRSIRLRYINRILLPMKQGQVQIDEFFSVAPHLPEEDKFTFTGFLNQHSAVEIETGNQINIVLTAQQPEENRLPVIFDNTVVAQKAVETGNWPEILATIKVLRDLKNRIFRQTLTQPCLDLFQQQ